jgi:RNA polymerase sigma-70 factor (ECF subfamily)
MAERQPISDELLEGIARGEEAAWESLVEQLSPQIDSIIQNQVRDNREHQDIAQEIFTKIFLKLDKFAGKSDFRHWVSRITLNTCYDWLRKKKNRPLTTYTDLGSQAAETIEKTLSNEEPPEDLDRALILETLQSLVETLKPREQIVIRLLDFEGLSVQDACRQTGWGASKVKVTAMRARRKLAALLEKKQSPGEK